MNRVDSGLLYETGIAPADLTRLFERCYRLDRASARRSGGAGLGLAIARWIAEAHGGRIEVESTVGQGSTFMVVLSLCDRSLSVGYPALRSRLGTNHVCVAAPRAQARWLRHLLTIL
jgi:hypothetical protein